MLVYIFFTLVAFFIGYFIRSSTQKGFGAPCEASLGSLFRKEGIAGSVSLSKLSSGHKNCSCHINGQKQKEALYIHRHKKGRSVSEKVFSYSPHPNSPSTAELLVASEAQWSRNNPLSKACAQVYMLRSPTRTDQETKCVAVVHLDVNYTSLFSITHRIGSIAWPEVLSDQYQQDWIVREGFADEKVFMAPMLEHRDLLIRLLKEELGEPLDAKGKRKTAIIMVANEMVIDLILNFICSCRAARIDVNNVIVFAAQKEHQALLRSFGIKCFFHEYLGEMVSSSAFL